MTILNKEHLLRNCREDFAYALTRFGEGCWRIEAAIENITDTLDDWDDWNSLVEKWKKRGEPLPDSDPVFISRRQRVISETPPNKEEAVMMVPETTVEEMLDIAEDEIESLTIKNNIYKKALESIGYQLNNNDGTGELWLRSRLTECKVTALEALIRGLK